MKFWKKLQNPYLLVGQGFVLGGILFFATHSDSIRASAADRPADLIAGVASNAG